jgi:multidrug efflux pump subunit AcrB
MQSVAEDLEYYLDQLESINRVSLNVSDNRPEVHMLFDPLEMTARNITLSNVLTELNSFPTQISTNIKFKQGIDEYDIMITQPKADADEENQDTRTWMS